MAKAKKCHSRNIIANPTSFHSLHVRKSYANPITKTKPKPNPKANPNLLKFINLIVTIER